MRPISPLSPAFVNDPRASALSAHDLPDLARTPVTRVKVSDDGVVQLRMADARGRSGVDWQRVELYVDADTFEYWVAAVRRSDGAAVMFPSAELHGVTLADVVEAVERTYGRGKSGEVKLGKAEPDLYSISMRARARTEPYEAAPFRKAQRVFAASDAVYKRAVRAFAELPTVPRATVGLSKTQRASARGLAHVHAARKAHFQHLGTANFEFMLEARAPGWIAMTRWHEMFNAIADDASARLRAFVRRAPI